VKIYTRTGDRGETGLFGGGRVPKDDLRVEAYGAVDELNSSLGVVLTWLDHDTAAWRAPLRRIQSDLFTVGAILATPEGAMTESRVPKLEAARVAEMEAWIDELDEELAPLKAFILPGGSVLAAGLHFARAVCRRVERRVVTLSKSVKVDPEIVRYLNRLSDLLFTLARAANARAGEPDVEWKPGKG
jgi:cob(I)alamin adenosyltransferase